MFLPQVAVAIKMHQRAKELVEKQRQLELQHEEKCTVEDIESEDSK